MFGVSDFWLETRVIIKIFKKMIPGMKIKVVFIGKHVFFFIRKKNQNGRLKKSSFSISANSQKKFLYFPIQTTLVFMPAIIFLKILMITLVSSQKSVTPNISAGSVGMIWKGMKYGK